MHTECKLIADALTIDFQLEGASHVRFLRADGSVSKIPLAKVPDGLALVAKAATAVSDQKRANLIKLLGIWLTLTGQGCDLLDSEWLGYREFYSIKLPSGRIVQRNIRTLQRNGVALQIEQDDRCYAAFKAVCEENQAELLAQPSQWTGVKTYYPVKQPDGLVIQVMPNTAMNYPWRRCALVELRQAASPHQVTLITAPEADPQLFRLDFGQGLFFDGSRGDLMRVLQSRARFDTVSKWLSDNQYVLADFAGTMDWSKKVVVRKLDGSTKKVPSPFQAEFDERRKVGLLRRRGRSYGVELVDTQWKGADARYRWTTAEGLEVTMKQEALPGYGGLTKVRAKGLEQGATLISTEFSSRYSTYLWKCHGVQFRATLRNLATRIQELSQ